MISFRSACESCLPHDWSPSAVARGLAAIAAELLGEDAFSGVVIVYRAKRTDWVKPLMWDSSGLVLVWKQPQQDAFQWPPL